MTKKTSAPKAELQSVSLLVSAYVDIAQATRQSSFGFVSISSDYSVRQIQDSIKQAKKECGISLADITPTKAQHFATFNAIVAQFPDIETTHTFAKVYAMAEKADRAYGANMARKEVAQFETPELLAESLPKTVRSAKPDSKATAKVPATIDELGDYLLEIAERLNPEGRVALIKKLVAVSTLIKTMDKVKANA